MITVFLCTFSIPDTASAHTHLIDSKPKQNEVQQEAPKTIQLHFSEQLQLDMVTISVTNPSAQSLPVAVKLAPKNPSIVIASLPPLAKGTYTVKWSVLSGDGHPVSGSYSFAYSQKVATTAGESSVSHPFLAFALILLRFLNEGWLLLSAGFIWVSFFASKRSLPNVTWFPSHRWKWFLAVIWLLLQIGIWLLYASELPQNLSTKLLLEGQIVQLSKIPYAMVLILQVLLFVLLLIPNMVQTWYLFLWTLITATCAFSGHLWSSPNMILALTARLLHIWSGALWLGGIAYLLLVSNRQQAKVLATLSRFRPFFSRMAFIASSLLIISGFLLVMVQTNFSAIITFQTFWSRFLAVKVMLVMGMIIYATIQTRQWKINGALERDSLRTEWIFGLIALLLGIWMSQIAYPILPP
jgi:copper transport protein